MSEKDNSPAITVNTTDALLGQVNYIQHSPCNVNPSISELQIVDQVSFSELCAPSTKNRMFNIASARLFLKAYGLTLRLNEMNHRAEIKGLPSKYGCEDSVNLLEILITDAANNLGYKRATNAVVHDALSVIAAENRFHPVVELLDSAPWDGFDRRSEIYNMLGLTDSFLKMLVYKWSQQTIAVLYNMSNNPVSSQGILTLQGPQGIGKTEFFRHLAIRDEFIKTGGTLDMSNKDTIISAVNVWITELGELDSTTKREQSALKAFLTERTDRFREPYARNETVRLRRTSFCGTVNPKGFLRDETGNRRYWVVPVTNINISAIFGYPYEWYAQYWRQMLVEYRNNPYGYLLSRLEQDMVNSNNDEYEPDIHGENEFMTLFDITAQYASWEYKTPAQIACTLNEAFKGLNISSEVVGKSLIPCIERKSKQGFTRKRGAGGVRMILCPPLNQQYVTALLDN